MTAALAVLAGLALIALRQPLYVILVVGVTWLYTQVGHGRIEDVIQDMVFSVDQELLLSVPLFILAGNIMARGSIARRLIRLAVALTAPVPGGLGVAVVLSCAVFATISGSSTVTLLAIGPIAYPALREHGYSNGFALGSLCAAATLGIIVPPSIPLILYGVATRSSITDLFLAGIGPALLLTALMAGYALLANRHQPRRAWHGPEVLVALRGAVWSLAMPVVILGGIYSGHFTATESAAVAVIYAFLISSFLYRTLKITGLGKPLGDTIVLTSSIMLIAGVAKMVGVVFAYDDIPGQVAKVLLSISENKFVLLLLINLFLLVLGLFLEPLAAMILSLPVLVPIAVQIGVDPVHFGIIVVLNLVIGLVTPPVGLCLFIVCGISKVSLEDVSRAALPMIGICILVLMLVTYFPELVLTIPQMFETKG